MKIPKIVYSPILTKIQESDKSLFKGWAETTNLLEYPTDNEEFLKVILQEASGCTNCKLCETRTQVVMPDGKYGAQIMILSEGPGFLEDLAGYPFVGPQELKGSRCNTCSRTGDCFQNRILMKPDQWTKKPKGVKCNPNLGAKSTLPNTFYLKSAGAILDAVIFKTFGTQYPRQNWIDKYNREHEIPIEHPSIWFVTNIVLCRSWDTVTLKDETPSNTYRTLCKKWFVAQWAAVNPKIIVCLGKSALEILVGGDEKARAVVHGEIFETKYGPVIYQPHPASIMRERHNESKAFGFAKLADTLKKAVHFVEQRYKEEFED
jgi:uracil-DNA glycosylase